MKKKNILITGYKGYLGSFLKKNLKDLFTFRNLNLDKIPSRNILKNYSHILHFEFLIKNSKKNLIKNIKNVEKVINICIENNIHMIFPSTASFYFKNQKKISDKIRVINKYTLAKKKCEEMISKKRDRYNLMFTILRIFNVYGGTINNRYYISKIIKKFKRKKIKIKFKDNIRDYIHILDLTSLIKKCILNIKNGTFEVGSGNSVSIEQLTKILVKLSNKDHTISYVEPKKTKNNFYSKADITKTTKAFKWKPKIKLEEGLKDLIKSY
jgi:UDP-glucose 4-epimerase